MKKLILLIALWCGTQTLYGQKKMKTEAEIKKYITAIVDNTNIVVQREINAGNTGSTGTLLSDPTLNNIFAKNIAYYLSGDNDISTFKNYFTSSSKEKTISVGYNFIYPNDDEKKLTSIASLGIKGGLGTFYQEKTLQNDVGVTANFTFLSNGIANFDVSEKKTLIEKRKYFKDILIKAFDDELSLFDSSHSIKDISPLGKEARDTERKKFVNDLYKKYRDLLANKEEDAAVYNFVKNCWVTFNAYIPVNTSKYNFASSDGKKIDTLNFYPIYGGVTLGKFKKWQTLKKFWKPSFVATLTMSIINDNSMRTLDVYGNISNRDTIASKLGLKKIKIGDTQVYQGNNTNFPIFNLKPRILLSWGESKVSVDLFGDFSFSKYSHHDAGFGVLFSLPDKDGKKPINIEPTFTIRDIRNNLIQDKSWLDKLLIGVSISLPFNSLVF